MSTSSNLTSGQVLPGFFGFVDYNAQGSATAPNLRTLIWGYISSAAQRTPNQPFLPSSQQDCDDGCGRGSDLTNDYAAAISQPEAQGSEIWVMPIAATAGNTASIYKLKVFVSNTNPVKSGSLALWINSQQCPTVGFTASDTSATIATALAAAINTMLDLPLGTATVTNTDVVNIPYMHKGLTGEDLPIRCDISPAASGVNLSPGQLLFATTSVGAGSVKVEWGAQSLSTTLAGSETAAAIAALVIASFNADTYPMTAVVDGSSSATVNLMFANGKDVRRLRASVITSTGTTVNLGSGATSGAGSASSYTYNGTLGVGAPSLTVALANLAARNSYRSHSTPFTDAASLGALATNLEAASDGSINGQKQQTLTACSSDPASVAGGVLTSTSPNLTTSAPHYAMLRAPDSAVKCSAIAARIAAARAAIWFSTPQKNWNGFQVRGSARSPILLPAIKPSLDAQNTALRTYGLAPVVVGTSGNLEVVKGRTTSLSNDKRLWAWSTEAQAAYHEVDLGLFFQSRFQGGSIVRYSEPKAPGIFDALSFKSATQERMRFWESQGNYDGANLLKDAVDARSNANNPFRVDVDFPESPVLDLDQVVFTGHFTSPAS